MRVRAGKMGIREGEREGEGTRVNRERHAREVATGRGSLDDPLMINDS